MIQRSDSHAVAELKQDADDDRFSNNYWTIGEMARVYGVSLRTLRFYEDRGLISPLRHGATRFYGPECRLKLERVLRAKKLGFTLSRISKMLQAGADAQLAETLAPGEIAAQIMTLERQKADLDHAISELRSAHAGLAVAGQPMARAG